MVVPNLPLRESAPGDPSLICMGRKPEEKSCRVLAESIARDGLLQPGLVAPVPPRWHELSPVELAATLKRYMIDPADFGPHVRFGVIAGNRRRFACRLAEVPFQARVLPEMPSPEHVARMMWHENSNRKGMNAYDQANQIMTVKDSLPEGATWADVAKALGIPEATVLLHASPRNIPDELRTLTEGLDLTVIRIIGRVHPRTKMREVIQIALGEDGKPEKKSVVEAYIRQMNKTSGRKPKWAEAKINGRTLRYEIRPGEKGCHLIADLEEAVKRLRRYGYGDLDGLGFVLA